MLPSKYCYKAGNHEACRYDREILKIKENTFNFRYQYYVYQVDLATHVCLTLFFCGLAFFVIKWEKLVKENQWIVYTISLVSVLVIEVEPFGKVNACI